jgi:hypothetical protein
MVTSIFPFNRAFNFDAPVIQQHHAAQYGDHTGNILVPKRITISRNFAPSGDGKSLLHQTFDRKILERNAAAPLRTAVNFGNNNYESFPASLL